MRARCTLVVLSALSTVSDAGTAHSIGTTGTRYKTLYSFLDVCEGFSPRAGLIVVKGTLHGTTGSTVYSISRTGADEEVLHKFALGAAPNFAGLLIVNGTLLGTMGEGGSSGVGTVHSLSATGADYRVLHSFAGGSAGSAPRAGLISVNDTLYVEVGRPAGTKRGSSIGAPIAINFVRPPLPVGTYAFDVFLGEEQMTHLPFDVSEGVRRHSP